MKHEHVFSPLCFDEVHGRFDVVETEGGVIVIDVGAGEERTYSSFGLARSAAQIAAADYAPDIRTLLRIEAEAALNYGPGWLDLPDDHPDKVMGRLNSRY